MKTKPLNGIAETLKDRLLAALFAVVKGGPSFPGYRQYRELKVLATIQNGFEKELNKPDFGGGLDERAVEYPWLMSKLPPERPGRLLDAGSALNYAPILSLGPLRNKELTVCTLAPEKRNYRREGLSYVYCDIRSLPFEEGFFDWIACLSTLEHVGMDNSRYCPAGQTRNEGGEHDYLSAVEELRRTLKPGGGLFITVPYGLRQSFGWFRVFDAAMIDSVIDSFAPSSFGEEYFLYAGGRWRVSDRIDARNARFRDPLGRGPGPLEPVTAGAVACLSLTK